MRASTVRAKPYPEYKPSGVAWLGDVPAHWEVNKITYGFDVVGSGTTPKSDSDDYYDEGEIPWVTTSELRENLIRETRQSLTQKAFRDYSSLKIYPTGTLLVAMYGATIGRLGILGIDAAVNQACCAFGKPSIFDAKYVFYWLLMRRPILIALSSGGGQPNLSQDELRQIRIPTPTIHEQQAIAGFLDRETAKLDELIGRKRTLIEALQEKRSALISRTMTRGLPPAAALAAGLDPHPPMKPSGIDWLGEVPAHWEIKSIKWESPVFRGASPRPIDDPIYFDDSGEYAWVRISDVTSSGMYLQQTEQKLSDLGSSLSVKLEPGALFLSIAGSVGKPCITKIACCIHDGFVYFPRWSGSNKYLYYVFASGEPYKGLGKLGTQLNLNTDTVGSIRIGIPPYREQHLIADYLDEITAEIDKMIAKVEAAIDKLQEYRAALITAAVTGKIDVRNAE
jgi:type I restriction enzyme S subunit